MSSPPGDSTLLERDRPRGFAQQLLGIYTAPTSEFRALAVRPRFLAPLIAFMAATVVFTAVWTSRVDPPEFMRAQIEQSPRAARLTADQRAQIVERQAAWFKPITWASVLLFTPALAFGVSALYLLVFRFFLGDEVGYRQMLAVVAWTFFAVALVTSSLTLLTLALKGDWSINPSRALQANLALALDRDSTPRPLYALAESVDLFSFWQLALLSIGFGAVTGRRASSAAVAVVALWAVWVVLKVGFVALVSMA